MKNFLFILLLAFSWPQSTNAQSITATINESNHCCIDITTTLPGLTVWILNKRGIFLDEVAVPLNGGVSYCFDGNGSYLIEAQQFIQLPGTPAPAIVEVEIIGCPYEIFVDPDPQDPCCVSIYTNLPGLLNVDVVDENGLELGSLTITGEPTEFCFEENGNFTVVPTTCICPNLSEENWPLAVDFSITGCMDCDNDDLNFGCPEKIINVSLDGCELCFSLYTAPECNTFLLNVNGEITEYPYQGIPGGYVPHCFQFPGEGDYEVSFAETDCEGQISHCLDGEHLKLCIEDCGPCNEEPFWQLVCDDGYFCIKDEFLGSPNMQWIQPPFPGDPTGHCQPSDGLANGDVLIFEIYTWVGETICTTTVNTVFDCMPHSGSSRESTNNQSEDATLTDSKITVFPNPSNGFININSSIGSNQTLQIINADGKEMLTKQLEGHNNSIDASSLSPGFYFVKIIDSTSGEKVHLEKVVIIK